MIQHEGTFIAALRDGVNLFLGAGFSTLARDSQVRPIPTGSDLAGELREHFEMKSVEGLSLPQICAILESTKREELRAFLRDRFTVKTYDDLYKALYGVNSRAIFTTNIDDLIIKLFKGNASRYVNDITVRGPVLKDREAIDFAPLHGSVADDSSPYVFTPLDLSNAFASDADKWHLLTSALQKRPTIFWGYSLGDAGALQALHPASVRGRSHKQKWIVLKDPDDGARAYFAALDFAIIESDTRSLLEYISRIQLGTNSVELAPNRPANMFPQEALPDRDSVPVRPISEFYLGSEPTWHDVYSGRIYRTSHYAQVTESIHLNKDTIVVGIPACGKTTLMMQVAAEISFPGHKLLLDAPSEEKAHLIVRKLNGEKALCLIDNVADYIDAFSTLATAPNVVVVGFDRDYNFELASHRVDRSKLRILDITGLDDRDIQEIFERIPARFRRDLLVRPEVEQDSVPSLYEMVERNILSPALGARYESALKELYKRDRVLHDLFVMICYVHSCRTPVSFDMVYAFMRGHVTSWDEAYAKIATLGSLVTDYSGPLIDSDQDYFTPRSTIISESVMKRVQHHALKQVLLQFHQEVSPLRICNYDVFRRKAFDADLMVKAFPDADEGRNFYDKLYWRDHSPYLLQQAALYLFRKSRTLQAFDIIDEAIALTHGKVPSIRNTHAVLLFKANIRADGDRDVIARTLKQSMDILAECYRFDRRKEYHAVAFAEQALQYWDVYGDDVALGYLKTAVNWLSTEKVQSPWHNGIQRLHKSVSRKLQQL